MASPKAKVVSVNSETNSLKDCKSNGSGPGGETAQNHRMYSLDDLETVATVGEFQLCHRSTLCAKVLGK